MTTSIFFTSLGASGLERKGIWGRNEVDDLIGSHEVVNGQLENGYSIKDEKRKRAQGLYGRRISKHFQFRKGSALRR